MGRHSRILSRSEGRHHPQPVREECGVDAGCEWVRRCRYEAYPSNSSQVSNLHPTDIDWEYPGGNGQDYKQIPNSDKVSEIQTYPKFVAAIKKAIGNKTLSVAVPGRKQDMIAFTKEQGPNIWQSVDMVNVMSYDLTNRRDNVTGFTSSVQGSLEVVNNYVDIGLDPAKMNLGFPYYAKWFTTDPNSDCDTEPIGCQMVQLENNDGSDNGKSGSLTFEKSTMAAPPTDLKTSTNGKCGYDEGTKCPAGSCCSQYGNWCVLYLLSFRLGPSFSFFDSEILTINQRHG